MFERWTVSREERFDRIFSSNLPLLEFDLAQTQGVSSVYEVQTPDDKRFYIAAYEAVSDDFTNHSGNANIDFLAIDPQTEQVVGFAATTLTFPKFSQDMHTWWVIATEETGHYHGYGLEIAKQQYQQEFANRERVTIVDYVTSQFDRTPVWNHFYGRGGVFGYGWRHRRKYSSSQAFHEPHERCEGFTITLKKDRGSRTLWSVTRDPEVLNRAAALHLQDKNNLKQKLSQLRQKRFPTI